MRKRVLRYILIFVGIFVPLLPTVPLFWLIPLFPVKLFLIAMGMCVTI
jgi:hypothetical protein